MPLSISSSRTSRTSVNVSRADIRLILLELILNEAHRVFIAVGGVALAQLGDEVVHVVGAIARVVTARGGGQCEAGVGGHVEIEAAHGDGIVAADELGLHAFARPRGDVSRDADGGKLIDDLVGGVGARGGTGLVVDEQAQGFHLLAVLVAVAVVGELVARAVQQGRGHQRVVNVADG